MIIFRTKKRDITINVKPRVDKMRIHTILSMDNPIERIHNRALISQTVFKNIK